MAGHVQKYLQLHQEAPVQRDVEACCTAYLYSYLPHRSLRGDRCDSSSSHGAGRILHPLALAATRPWDRMSRHLTAHSCTQRTCARPRVEKRAVCGRQRLGQGNKDTCEGQLCPERGFQHMKENSPLFCFLTILMILHIQMSLQNETHPSNSGVRSWPQKVSAVPQLRS